MPQISLLLSTYNSERFLHEFIESLFNQTYKNWILYIVDDGSIDNTPQIINEYERLYPFIKVMNRDLTRQGAMSNFFYLLHSVGSDYFMFCDHDDVWLPQKIEKTFYQMLLLEKDNPNLPVVVHTDLCVVNSDLSVISDSFFKFAGINPVILLSSIYHLSHSNCVTGCTMLINNLAKQISFPVADEALMHDSWISLSVLKHRGIIHCIYESLILYRQHNSNTLGAISKNRDGFTQRLLNLKKTIYANNMQFKMAKKVTNVSIFQFVLYRLIYLIKNRKK